MTNAAKQRRSKHGRLDSSEKLLALAQEASGNPNKTVQARLIDGINHLLRSGADNVLLEALFKSRDGDNPVIPLEMESLIENLAMTDFVDSEEGMLRVTVGLIPVISIRRGGLDYAQCSAIDYSAAQEISEVLKRHDLVRTEARVIIVQYLYHPYEITSMPWSAVGRLPKVVLENSNGSPVLAEDLGQTGWPERDEPLGEGVASFELRFLMFAIADEADSPEASLVDSCNQSNMTPEMRAKFSALRDELDKCLLEYLPSEGKATLHSGEPLSFYEGMRSGFAQYDHFSLMAGVLVDMRSHHVKPSQVAALISPTINEEAERLELRVAVHTLEENPMLVSGHVIPVLPWGDLTEHIQSVCNALGEAGITSVEVHEGISEGQTCSCCGEPSFEVPNDSAGGKHKRVLH